MELARGHLPAGELAPNAPAAAYPAEAYLCLQDEVPPGQWEREVKKVGVAFCEDLPGKFDDAFSDATPKEKREFWSSRGASRFAGYFGGWIQISRKGFERVTRLRNRTLGPLAIPKHLLRKGPNALAVELRASHIHPVVLTDREANWGRAFQREMFWSHCRLLDLELRSSDARTPSALERPRGLQVWVEDMHRVCFADDFGPAGGAGIVRFVGGANGTYSAQIVVGSDRGLTGLRVTPGPLRSAAGELPADALRVGYLVGHPATELVQLGQIRNMVEDRADPLCPPAEMAVVRYGPSEARAGAHAGPASFARPRVGALPRAERLKLLGQLRFFDHIGAEPPARVPAGTAGATATRVAPFVRQLACPRERLSPSGSRCASPPTRRRGRIGAPSASRRRASSR